MSKLANIVTIAGILLILLMLISAVVFSYKGDHLNEIACVVWAIFLRTNLKW